MVEAFLVQKSDIKQESFQRLIENYSDLNLHLDKEILKSDTLITIVTDLTKDHLAVDLQIVAAKLHSVDYKSRRISAIKTVVFAFDDVELEITKETVGERLFLQYQEVKQRLREDVKTEVGEKSALFEKTVYTSFVEDNNDETIMGDNAGFSGLKEFLVPKWELNKENGLENWIGELITAKAMGVLPSDKLLIYAACVRSGKTSMLENITQNQRENLTYFIAYLRDEFGKTLPELRADFDNAKQRSEENEIDYFNRLERLYFSSKNITKPSGNVFKDWMKEDVMHQFRMGMRNNEVRRLLMLNSTTIKYEDLAKTAKNYAVSLKDINKVYSVNAVNDGRNEEVRHEENEPRRSRRMRTPYRK